MTEECNCVKKKNWIKALTVLLVAVAVIGVIVLKPGRTSTSNSGTAFQADGSIPIIVDFGAGKCAACKALKPVMADLKKEYPKTLKTVFIDVWENEAAAEKYAIQAIPTLIFFDKNGKELFRYQGFMSKDDIVKKWKELGIKL